MNSITDKIELTNEQIEAKFAEVGVDLALDYGDDENIIVTTETLDDLRASRVEYWNLPGKVSCNTETVFQVEHAQAKRGDQRCRITAIDFGEVRLVFKL